MALNLTITSYQRLSPGQIRSKALEQGRLTVGRSPDNDWVLSDPEMVLSKSHCYIDCRNDGFYITDTSTNGVFINQAEQRLGRGNSVKLNDQDTITLGDYEISVQLGEAVEQSNAVDLAGKPEPIGPEWTDEQLIPSPAEPSVSSAYKDDRNLEGADNIALPESLDADDPLGLGADTGDDRQDPSWDQYSHPDHLPSEREVFQPPRAVPDASMPQQQKEEDDPFLDSLGLPITPISSPAGQTPKPAIPDDWEDSLIARLIKDDDDSASQPASQTRAEPSPPQQADIQIEPDKSAKSTDNAPAEASLNPFADLENIDSDEPGSFTERIPAFKDAESQSFSPVEPKVEKSSPIESVPAESSPPQRIQSDSARPRPDAQYTHAARALLQSAGMSEVKLGEAEALEVLQKMGKIYRRTVQGMMELLRARGTVKSEFHMERTMVGPIENNPLKIMPTVDEAMNAMLLRHDHTWIPADRAINEGFADLRAHELAFMAGMQAALKHLLATFDPLQLEQELGKNSMWSNLLRGRKARYWDAFTALYGKIARKAEDDFQDLFRKEFARAYQAQLDKLRQQRES